MPDFGGFVARDISFMHKIVNRMRYLFYNKFLVDGTDASDESQCGENTGLSVCSFSPSKQKKWCPQWVITQVLQSFVMYFICWHCFCQLYPAVQAMFSALCFVSGAEIRPLTGRGDGTNARVKGYSRVIHHLHLFAIAGTLEHLTR